MGIGGMENFASKYQTAQFFLSEHLNVYLFVKAAEEDAAAFCERAKKYELLLVNGADFGYKGWVRIAYCVQTERIEKALPLFKKLAEEYGL